MDTTKNIRASLKKLYGKIKSGKEISEEDLRVAFVKSGILEVLGYEGELKDVRFEKNVKGKRSDLLAFDDYQNVVFVVEFKKPGGIDLEQDFAQLWEKYVKPLKARYGLLTDGLELLLYERINSNWERKLRVNLGEVTLSQCEDVYDWLKKPSIERTRIEAVLGYFGRFDNPEEKVNLSSEIAQKHFFDGFELKEGSVFVNLVQMTIGLFDFELERSKFLKSAYNFWKISYAKKPEKVPENWKRIMDKIGLETNEENLFKFMFCLESAYSLFTRLILAKACEDYKLPYIDFSDFIKREIERTSHRGDISSLAWPITTKNLIENMKENLVKSVFEGDIFYWWEDSYKELRAGDFLYSPYHRYEKQKAYFGDALADIILTLYKFDFSEIVGDPLGTLYQRYFDKETRKALGEFYTPQEVVEYILDAVGYEGRGVIGKRLLDPACGSGTFLVEALRRYLKASEQIAEETRWSEILKELCNKYRIAGFDIHPFATFMAQMQFMLVLIPAYKKAMEEDPHFVLNRLPIFRTDSLVDETKGEARKVTIEESAKGIHHISIDTGLPVDGGNLKINMPYSKDVLSRTDLYDVHDYFAALQAVFDTVKKAAWQGNYEVDKKELERNFKRYLEDRNWSGLVSFFTPYAKHFLQKFKELKDTFGDGKLIKSLEDIMLAAILKNYVKYDFVVGNPPYVNIKKLSEDYKKYLRSVYTSAREMFDLYVIFTELGLKKLVNGGKFGYIVPSKFLVAKYGKALRDFILDYSIIVQLVDVSFVKVFADSTPYPVITLFEQSNDAITRSNNTIMVFEAKKNDAVVLDDIKNFLYSKQLPSDDSIRTFEIPQKRFSENIDHIFDMNVSEDVSPVIENLERISVPLKRICDVLVGIQTKETVRGASKKDIIIDENHYESLDENQRQIYKKKLDGYNIDRYRISWDKKFVKYERKLLYNTPPEEVFKKAKILIRDISIYPSATLDEQQYYCFDTIYLVAPIEAGIDLRLILGILNSNIAHFYYASRFSPAHVGGGYLRFRKPFVEKLPIRLPKTPEEQDLADEITKKVKQILEKVKIEQQLDSFPDEYIQEYRSKGEEFDSKSIAFNSNHKALEPVIEKTVDGRGYNIVIGKKEKPVYAESKVKANYIVTALKGKSAKKDEKKQILIPKSDAIVEEILKKLEKDKAKTKTPSVAELEEEINELVYKLYGLNEKDINVIEDFLRRL